MRFSLTNRPPAVPALAPVSCLDASLLPLPPRRRASGAWWLALVAALALLPGWVGATHIVGGQLGMRYISRGVYDLTFTLYFDAANGNPGAFDSVATVVVYERGRRRLGTMDTISLLLLSRDRVQYTNPGCRTSSLSTDEVHYGRRVFLDPDRYASPRGYYMAWQRASRNYVITNLNYILPGSNPPVPGTDVGQTFVLQFPALKTATGADFVNSSPTAFLPLRDYACVGRAFRYPFGGLDPDGDSLVYDLVTPLQYVLDSLQNNFTIPVPGPAPYPPIVWAPGFDSTHQITGPQPLRVNRRTGEITFTAGQAGLYVFGVRVREYRGRRLLGELRREFQELVVTCSFNQTPVLTLTPPGPPRTGPILGNGQLVTLPAPGVPGERCLNVYAIDPDTTTRLRLRVVPVDSLPISPLISITTGVVNLSGRGDSLYSRLCFPDCFATGNIPLRLWVIAEDEGCPQPQPDTVLLIVRAPGTLGAITQLSLTPGQLAYSATAGQTISFAFTGTNADNQPVTVTAADVNGGPLSAAVGLLVPPVTAPGTATTLLTWPVTCATPPGTYRIRLLATVGGGNCNAAGATDTVVTVTVTQLPNAPTLISGPGGQGPGQNQFSASPGQTVTFSIGATDADPDLVSVTALAVPGGPAGTGLSFSHAPALGRDLGLTTWVVGCATPSGTYRLRYRVSTAAAATGAGCRPAFQLDTAAYITVLPPANAPTTVQVEGDRGPGQNRLSVQRGDTLAVVVRGNDADADLVTVTAPGLATGPLAGLGITATPVPGPGQGVLTLRWPVSCATPTGTYRIGLRAVTAVSADGCRPATQADTAAYVTVLPGGGSFDAAPPNVITPNGDHLNDVFAPRLSRSGDPADCDAGLIRRLRVYSRWGRQVYVSTAPDAHWDGESASAGLYYYLLEFTNRPSVKGWVELIR